MKRFVWRLQRLLEIKANEEQKKKAELFKLTEQLAQARNRLLAQQRILRDMLLKIAENEPQKRLPRQELFLKYSATTDEQIKKLKNQAAGLQEQQNKKIAEFLKVKQFKQGLDKLRSEAKRRYIAQQEKLQQKELDESATVSFVRNQEKEQ